MAMLDYTYSANDLPSNDFELLPAGVYVAQIIKSQIRDHKNGTGNRLVLSFQIVEGDYTNRIIFHDVPLRNTNSPKAEKYGREQLAQLCQAVGLAKVGDSAELHNRPMQIRVGIAEDKTGQYEPKNVVKQFSAHGHQAAPRSSAPILPSAPARPASAPQRSPMPSPVQVAQTTQAAPAPSSPWARKA